VYVDSTGNVWVADSLNNRIQKFDPQGHFLGQFGTGGTGEGQFTEPWSVAVDRDGFIYVADTWNHRIQKFDPTFKFVTMWGQPGANNPGPLDFFGPRDIVIAADGTLWITDTGNQRLLHFTKDGQPLDTYGSGGSDPGQFSEPVGLAADSAGDLVVADAWNGRVQVLPASGAPPFGFATQWTSHEVTAKPYVSVLSDGRLIVSVPETGSLVLYSATGGRIGAWKPLVDSMPIGLAPTADGGFVFSDGRRNEVQVVPARLIAGLFQP
jgi:DNA-binding beta-propeller fold protein YncE